MSPLPTALAPHPQHRFIDVIETLRREDRASWDTFVREHPRGTFFHLTGWADVMQNTLGHRSHYLTARRGGGILGVLPLVEIKSRLFGHALLSNAFCVAGGPLAFEEAVEDELMTAAAQLARDLNVDYAELKDTPRAPDGWHSHGELYAGFERGIDADETACLAQVPRKQRAVVRKAIESDLTVTLDDGVDTVFELYSRTVRDHGTPVFPKALFKSLRDVFGTACEVLTVRQNEQPISSVMSFYFRDRVLPYYTGSLLSARDMGANDLMYWRLMRHAAERGCTTFDFGRSKVGTGPFSFKKNWGFPPRPITHQFYLHRAKALPNLNPTNPKFSLAVQSWRKLPLPVANLIGPFISRSLG